MSRESEDGQGGENYRNQQKICQQPQGERGGDFGLWSVRVGEIFPHFQLSPTFPTMKSCYYFHNFPLSMIVKNIHTYIEMSHNISGSPFNYLHINIDEM